MGCTMGGGAAKRNEHPLEALLVMLYKEQEVQTRILSNMLAVMETLVIEVDEDGQPIRDTVQ